MVVDMKKDYFLSLIENPEIPDASVTSQLKDVLTNYPYFQSARICRAISALPRMDVGREKVGLLALVSAALANTSPGRSCLLQHPIQNGSYPAGTE